MDSQLLRLYRNMAEQILIGMLVALCLWMITLFNLGVFVTVSITGTEVYPPPPASQHLIMVSLGLIAYGTELIILRGLRKRKMINFWPWWICFVALWVTLLAFMLIAASRALHLFGWP